MTRTQQINFISTVNLVNKLKTKQLNEYAKQIKCKKGKNNFETRCNIIKHENFNAYLQHYTTSNEDWLDCLEDMDNQLGFYVNCNRINGLSHIPLHREEEEELLGAFFNYEMYYRDMHKEKTNGGSL